MRGKQTLACLCGLTILAALNSGCALRSLKEANQRLKESNDRLISENNRLEHELAQLQSGYQGMVGRPAPAVAPSEGSLASRDPVESILPEIVDEIRTSDEGIHLTIRDRVFFSLGQAKLSRKGQSMLRRLGSVIRERYPDRLVRVDGHTDDIPVRKVRHLYPSNWELSTARACTVVRYLVENGGISPRKIYPAGFAYYRPRTPGKSASARSQNRRVEITILNRRA